MFLDPRNTSRTCPQCGLIAKRHRPHQASFRCIGCGFAGPADTIAARNNASQAAVNRSNAAGGSA
ncbi:MAG: zinc ribbon domain-containing protein [Firmicutes bacterium]|nr:zinc ribbon domain-containing protein [Bacillota bacterium]